MTAENVQFGINLVAATGYDLLEIGQLTNDLNSSILIRATTALTILAYSIESEPDLENHAARKNFIKNIINDGTNEFTKGWIIENRKRIWRAFLNINPQIFSGGNLPTDAEVFQAVSAVIDIVVGT